MALRDMKEKISGVRAATHIGVQLTVEMMEVRQLTLVSPWSSSSHHHPPSPQVINPKLKYSRYTSLSFWRKEGGPANERSDFHQYIAR